MVGDKTIFLYILAEILVNDIKQPEIPHVQSQWYYKPSRKRNIKTILFETRNNRQKKFSYIL